MKPEDFGRPARRTAPSRRRPNVESLEGRTLLSQASPLLPTAFAHTAGGAAYLIQVSGPGRVRVGHLPHGQVAIALFGTTPATQVTVTPQLIRPRYAGTHLQIGKITVSSGQLGSFTAGTTADLVGPMSPLNGPVQMLQFDALGGAASIQVTGSLGQLAVTNAASFAAGGGLKVAGPVSVGGNLNDSGAAISATGLAVAGNLSLAAGTLTTTALGVGGAMALGGGADAEVAGGNFGVVGDLDIAAGGLLHVAQDLTAPLTVGGNLNLDGGRLAIDRAVSVGGNLAAIPAAGGDNGGGAQAIRVGGLLTVGGNLTDTGAAISATNLGVGGTLSDAGGTLTVTALKVGGAMALGGGADAEVAGGGALGVGGDLDIAAGGLLHVAQDLTAPLTVGGNLNLDGGRLAIDRDLTGGLTVGGDLKAGAGGTLAVGRDADAIRVTGDVDTSGGGHLTVGGNLVGFTVSGKFVGKGPGSGDMAVGLDLDNFQVLGGAPDQGGVNSVDLAVGKNFNGISVPHGIYRSFVTAGVAIDGTSNLSAGEAAGIGPDGTVAVFDTTILAETEIRNLTIGGDVSSDMPTNPARIPTRIVAGEDRLGDLMPNGVIDNFQITGRLIDSVVAASVAPPGDRGIYDQPAGTITVGYRDGPNTTLPNYTAPPFAAPNPTDVVLPGGAINPSFAPPPQPPIGAAMISTQIGPNGATVITTVLNANNTETITTTGPNGTSSVTVPAPNTPIPVPSQSTVLGGVVSTPHGPVADYAGLFAANTVGVIVGGRPAYASATGTGG